MLRFPIRGRSVPANWPAGRGLSIPSPLVDEVGDQCVPNRLPALDADERQCWDQFISAASALYRALNGMLLKEHNLSLFDVHVLHLLNSSPGGSARMGFLSEELLLLPSRLSQQVGRLEKQGLVRRDRCARDKRVVIARITPMGRARLQAALRTYARDLRKSYLAPLSRPQMTALGAAAWKISEALKQSAVPPGFSGI
jgi:DNA-binding MarR family transcriptional regulator